MAEYTTQVRNICESLSGLPPMSNVDDIINAAIPKIFDFPVELHNPEHKHELFYKILLHYYTREIGLETYGLWKLKLRTRLGEILPYYNELYATVEMKYDPLTEIDYTRSGTREDIGTANRVDNVQSNSTTTDTGDTWELYSDTPQGSLSGVDSGEYLTTATKNTINTASNVKGQGETKSNNNTNNQGTYTEKLTGKNSSKSYSELIQEYRKAIVNVDLLLIESLNDLFMLIW